MLCPVRDTATDISKNGLLRSIVYVINHDNFELHRAHSDRVFKNLEKLTTGHKYITNECEFLYTKRFVSPKYCAKKNKNIRA